MTQRKKLRSKVELLLAQKKIQQAKEQQLERSLQAQEKIQKKRHKANQKRQRKLQAAQEKMQEEQQRQHEAEQRHDHQESEQQQQQHRPTQSSSEQPSELELGPPLQDDQVIDNQSLITAQTPGQTKESGERRNAAEDQHDFPTFLVSSPETGDRNLTADKQASVPAMSIGSKLPNANILEEDLSKEAARIGGPVAEKNAGENCEDPIPGEVPPEEEADKRQTTPLLDDHEALPFVQESNSAEGDHSSIGNEDPNHPFADNSAISGEIMIDVPDNSEIGIDVPEQKADQSFSDDDALREWTLQCERFGALFPEAPSHSHAGQEKKPANPRIIETRDQQDAAPDVSSKNPEETTIPSRTPIVADTRVGSEEAHQPLEEAANESANARRFSDQESQSATDDDEIGFKCLFNEAEASIMDELDRETFVCSENSTEGSMVSENPDRKGQTTASEDTKIEENSTQGRSWEEGESSGSNGRLILVSSNVPRVLERFGEIEIIGEDPISNGPNSDDEESETDSTTTTIVPAVSTRIDQDPEQPDVPLLELQPNGRARKCLSLCCCGCCDRALADVVSLLEPNARGHTCLDCCVPCSNCCSII